MRGPDQQQFQMISYVSLEKRVPAEHPLRTLWALTNAVLQELSPLFDQLYAGTGRPSIAPEKLLRAILLQVLYSIRSEALAHRRYELAI
jgi:transposase